MNSLPYSPKIIAFLCHWCAYAGADAAGSAQRSYPHQLQVVRVMCSGRVEPHFVLHAFRSGADGVLIMACHPGECHYKEGNCRALQRHRLLIRVLDSFGIASARCRLEYVSAGEAERFCRIVTDMVETVTELGALPLRSTGSDAVADGSAAP